MSRIYPGRWFAWVKTVTPDGAEQWTCTEPATYEEVERLCLLFGLADRDGEPFALFEGKRVTKALLMRHHDD